MRAQVLKAHGGPENFILEDVPIPEVEAGKILVKIAAASVNPIDLKVRQGLPVGPALPAILGADMAGTVEAVGPDVTSFAIGDKVYGMVSGVRGYDGTLAEYVLADADLLAPAPRSLALREAAALPLVAITAFETVERIGISDADHVLVHAGTGGVGHIVVQLAKARGAKVAATVGSEKSAEIARSLGADDIIFYKSEDTESYVARLTDGKGFPAIVDTVGGANLPNSLAAAAQEGRIVTIDGRTTLDISPMHGKALSLAVVFVLIPLLERRNQKRHGATLRKISALVDEGKLRPLIDPKKFTLETAADAHAYVASGQAIGKVVIDITPE